jgi:hypothetical protein
VLILRCVDAALRVTVICVVIYIVIMMFHVVVLSVTNPN